MQLYRATLDDCSSATGTVVVIDVLRAFTTAAYAFAAGARHITLVSSVAEAFALLKCDPGLLLVGEVGGAPVPGFDFGNSPAALAGVDLTGRRLVHRTSNGTQGVVRSTQARALLAASFVCAGATARYIRQSRPPVVTFVITAGGEADGGDEDAACADYIHALLEGHRPDAAPYLQRVLDSTAGRRFLDPGDMHHPAADLPYCLALGRFDFAMQIKRREGSLRMEAVNSVAGSARQGSG